ncbi:uncharacterized protein LOC113240276 [Hyposmocoma kahamanoa]|uniref:uncharacterized protein LOC113240276 n=1 Tax=Hyposmocoma kahamanoa TaxID=1477025 RepID=UPI000E6D7D2E|nr:uncharacterized protein LOC113240276 [Hyposmocoma kahamanoa]
MVASFATVECAIPGTFFWKPRLALIMAIPTTEMPDAKKASQKNIEDGVVVIIDGFKMAMSIAALSEDLVVIKRFPQSNPSSAYFYTTAYRWALRYLSLLPDWLSGKGGHYAHTHRVWKRRFRYLDAFVPKWIRPLLPFIKKSEWEREEKEYKGYKKYSEKIFSGLYQYPGKQFKNFASQQFTYSASHDTSSISCFDCKS